MLDYILRFIVTLLIITGIAFLIPTLVIFFLQVLITVSVFLVILFVLSLFYKGKTDDEIRLEETNRQVEEAKKALDTFSINKWGVWIMILKFLKQLFCFPHHYEQELSPFDDEWWEECRKCDKTRKVKKVII